MASFIPLRATQRPSLTPLDPGGSTTYVPASAKRGGGSSRRRLAQAAVFGTALVSSAYLSLHLLLPTDHGLRASLLMPYDPSVVVPELPVEFWTPPTPQLAPAATADDGSVADSGVDAALAAWSLPNLTAPALQQTYRVFQPPAQPAYGGPADGVAPVDILGDACLEKWLGSGEACDADEVAAKEGELDVVWTWVNGSDPTWHAHFAHYADPSITSLPAGWGVPPIRHYRNKDELRHSLRSLFRSMGVQGHVRTFHLVLGDWALGGHAAPVVKQFFDGDIHAWQAADGGREWRVGQMPEWLNATVLGLERAGLTVKVHHHSEIFKDRTVDNEEAAMQYRSKALPNFNSFAIEGQLINIPDLAQSVLYLNDDFFLTRPHTKSDYYTPLYGPVLGLVFPAWVPAQEYPATACVHEWSAMLRSNWLFGHRFGERQRLGLQHIPKVFSRAALEEVATTWKTDFAHSSRRRFREVEREESDESRVGDLHATWMASSLMIERAREAMLWSWAVARVGGLDGVWSKDARKEVARLFNVTASAKVGVVSAFDRQVRDTVQWDTLSSTLSGMGLDEPMSTQYRWASLDGALPRDHGDVHSRTEVNLDVCFGAFWTKRADTSAVEIFTRIAFLHHECGDKIIAALINASGPAGLSAFLPAAGTVLPISDPLPTEVQPHMPLTKTWRGTDFNLRAVVQSHEAEVDVRAWVLRLLARYQYTSGNSEYEFAMIHHAVDMLSVLKVDADGSRIASLAINDDLEGSDEEIEDGAQAIKAWLRHEWPEPGWWEREE